MKTDPLVSIIIRTYNRADYLRLALDSVFHQEYDNFEVILVDDGSTDSTRTLIESYDQNKIKYICQDHKGQRQASHEGIKHAAGDIIGWLDDDDVYHLDFLQDCINEFLTYPETGIVYTDAYVIGEADEVKSCKVHYDYTPLSRKERSITMFTSARGTITNGTICYKKECYDYLFSKLSPDEIIMACDYPVYAQLLREFDIRKICKTVFMYREHSGMVSRKSMQNRHELVLNTLINMYKIYPLDWLFPNLDIAGKDEITIRIIGAYLMAVKFKELERNFSGTFNHYGKMLNGQPGIFRKESDKYIHNLETMREHLQTSEHVNIHEKLLSTFKKITKNQTA